MMNLVGDPDDPAIVSWDDRCSPVDGGEARIFLFQSRLTADHLDFDRVVFGKHLLNVLLDPVKKTSN